MFFPSSFASSLKRHGALLTALGGFVFNKEDVVKKTLGSLRGPVEKIAQLSLMVPGLLSPSYEHLCQHIVSSRNSESSWGSLLSDMNNIFSLSLETCPRFSASLSQVYYGIYEGKPYAFKQQYPHAQSFLSLDGSYLKTLGYFYEKTMGGLHYEKIMNHFLEAWHQELNYEREKRFMGLFSRSLQDETFLHVPKALEPLCSSNLLVMEWKKGFSLKESYHLSQEQKNTLGLLIFKAWMTPLFSNGLLHGDPQENNITWFLDDHQQIHVNILDFGCHKVVSSAFLQDIRQLFYSLYYGDRETENRIYEQWGFEPLTPLVLDFLHAWSLLLFSPFFSSKKESYTLVSRDYFDQGKKLCLHYHGALSTEKTALFVPWEALLFNRLGVILASLLHGLKAQQPWNLLFQQILEKGKIKPTELTL